MDYGHIASDNGGKAKGASHLYHITGQGYIMIYD